MALGPTPHKATTTTPTIRTPSILWPFGGGMLIDQISLALCVYCATSIWDGIISKEASKLWFCQGRSNRYHTTQCGNMLLFKKVPCCSHIQRWHVHCLLPFSHEKWYILLKMTSSCDPCRQLVRLKRYVLKRCWDSDNLGLWKGYNKKIQSIWKTTSSIDCCPIIICHKYVFQIS